jgi:pyruvate ferredoxin oxidoreductase gamma subunit
MIELKFFGRAGQGGKTASELIADSALDEGKFTQAFPEYGPEREGAPVKAFVRIDKTQIRVHCQIKSPDIVVVIDPTLLDCLDVIEGLKEEGTLIVNTHKSPEEIRNLTGFKGKIFTVDGTRISMDIFGKNFPNMPVLGALVKATGIVQMKSLEGQIACIFLKKIGEEKTKMNVEMVKRAYEEAKTDAS